MNKQRHRLVFNARRGQIMAVAESASSCGAGRKGERRCASHSSLRSMTLGLSFSLLLGTHAFAQIVTDPHAPAQQRPTVQSAANGVPLVHIQTPSAAGVSHNTYRQFDVSGAGVILNNSPGQTQTQLGGWVQSNPWLAAGSARVILNEVNSAHPSHLNGYVEVAGQRAQVIIANPSGIQVQGGGFINVNRAVLTTGAPIVQDGALEGFRVRRGTIGIHGAGLDASSTDYTTILARATEINAGLWANDLRIVTGANEVSADLGSVRAEPAGATGETPAYALDVAELGGMYVGKIHLVGTEAGVGVNLRGVIGASAGDVVIDASGWLRQRGTLQASGQVRVQAQGEVHNEGRMYAGADLSIHTEQDLSNLGQVDALGDIELQAQGIANQAGAHVAAQGDLLALATSQLGNQGELAAGGELTVRTGALVNIDGRLQGQRLDIDTQSLENTRGSIWQTGQQELQLELGRLDNAGGRIGQRPVQDSAGSGGDTGPGGDGAATDPAPPAGEPGGSPGPAGETERIDRSPGLIRVAAQAVNQDGVMAAEGVVSASLRDGLLNRSGAMYVDRIDVHGADLDNESGHIGAREARLSTASVDNTDGVIEAQALGLETGHLDNTRGLLSARQALNVVATERLDNVQGHIQSSQASVRIAAGRLNNTGQLYAAGDMDLSVVGEMVNAGLVAALGDTTIVALSMDSTGALAAGLRATGQLATQGNLHVATTQTLRATGQNLAAGDLALTGSALDIRGSHSTSRNMDLHASVGDIDTRHAVVVVTERLSAQANTTQAQRLDNTEGTLSAGHLQLAVAHLGNARGTLEQTGHAATTLALQTSGPASTFGTLDNTGGTLLMRGDDLTLRAEQVHNQDGRILHLGQGELDIHAHTTLDNTGGQIQTHGVNFSLQAARADNQQGRIAHAGQGALRIVSQSGLNNTDGLLQSDGNDFHLQAEHLINQGGEIVHTGAGDLTISTRAALDNRAGEILGNGHLHLQAARLDNRTGGHVAAGAGAHIDVSGTLDNARGLLRAMGAMAVQAQNLVNNDGQVLGGADVAVRADDIDNTSGGLIHATGDLVLRSTHLDNTAGRLQAMGHITALIEGQAATLLNREGSIRAGGATTLAAQRIDNRHTSGAAQGIEGHHVFLETDDLDNREGHVAADQNLAVTSKGTLDNTGGTLSAGHTLSLLDPGAAAGSNATLAIANTGGIIVADERVHVHAARLGLDGQVLSGQDMSLNLAGDHHIAQGATLIANRDLAMALNGGDLTNEGTLQAGRLLQVDARQIANRASGTLSAATTQLTASAGLVNEGLIDGIVTDVRAQDLTNTGEGRIYGDAIRLQARGHLLNEGAAVVAARASLHVGVAGELTNRDGATLLSLGELAVGGTLDANGQADGAVQAIHNRSATIESLGDMRLAASVLNNINDQVDHRVVPQDPISRTDYYTASGYIGSEDVAWTAPSVLFSNGDYVVYWPNRTSILPKTSAYADPAYQAYFLGPKPFVPEHMELVNPVNEHYVRVPDAFNVNRHSPLWQALGMAAPTWDAPGPRPQPVFGVNDIIPPDPAAVAEWLAKAAPWQELQSRFDAFQQTVRSQLLDYSIFRSYTEVASSAEVTAGQPGHIRSAGDLQLHVTGTALNQDSSILAGGSIQIQGGSVVNQSTEVSTPTQRSGTVSHWTVVGYSGCGGLFGCDPIYGWQSAPYAETIQRTVPLASVRYEQGVQPLPPSQPPGALELTQTQAQAAPVSDVSSPPAAGAQLDGAPSPLLPLHDPGTSSQPAQVAPGLASPSATPEGARIDAPSLATPTSSLFQLHPGSTASYLVETDPRFTDHRQWLSSDYMLAALSVDPATTQKRLGDGFYEQQLVREQVAQLTGQRLLGHFTSDEQQYQALMSAGVTFAHAHELRPGIALSAAQVAALTSDIVWLVERTVTLPDGSTTQALVPQLYVRPQAGDLQPSGALIAGRDVNLNLGGDLTNAGGTIAGRQITRITAENIHQLGGLITGGQTTTLLAEQDIRNTGGVISAGSTLLLDAGRDLSVQTTTTQGLGQAGAGSYASTGIDRVAALYVNDPGGLLLASAGRDLTLTAAIVQSAGDTRMQAGRDLALQTVQARTDIDVTRDSRNFARVQQSEDIGTRIASQGSTTLIAGQDIQARAAQVQAQGTLDAHAGRDVHIESGENALSTASAGYARGRGFLSSGSSEVREQRSTTDAVASSLGGERVNIQSGQDTTVIGSQVIGDAGTSLEAGRDVNLSAAQTTSSESRFEEHRSSGVFASGAGITIGQQQHSTDQQTQATGAAASTVGAISGDVDITAGQTYRQTGSDVLAPGGDVNIQAQAIQITEARITEQHRFEEKTRQSGLSIGVGGGVIDAAQGVAQTLEAVGETQNTRMKALGIAAAGLRAKGAIDGVNQALKDGKSPTEAAGASLNISVGSSRSQSTSQSQSDSAQGSTIQAGGDVNLIASTPTAHPEPVEGAGNILVRGSEVSAGNTVRLNAEGDIELVAAQNTTEQNHQNSSKSGSVGVSLGTQTGVTLAASKGKGQGAGEETTYTPTRIEAGELIQLDSGQNTTLQGAVVQAEQVQANVGGDLKIESLQDTSTYHESSQQAGGSLTIGPSPGGSISVGGTRIDSDYTSVNEQSGIRAGDGGFQVEVQGQTELIGGAITSTQEAVDEDRNAFNSAGGLRTSDIQNRADYQADGSGVTLGVGTQLSSSGAGIGSESGNASSTTQAAISGIAGNTEARTGDSETGIAPIFDQERVRQEVGAQVEITKAFGQAVVPLAASYADGKAIQLRREGNEEEARKWDEGGEHRMVLHGAIGFLTGGVAGAAGAATGAALIHVIGEEIASMNLPDSVREIATQVAGAALGAATGDLAGAAASLNQTAHNYISRSPFVNVRRAANQENARLLNECGANCTQADFLRIDQQVAAVERAGNLAEINQRSTLTTEQALQLGELLASLHPLYGTPIALYQTINGKGLATQTELDAAARFFNGVAAAVPLGSAAYKIVTHAAQDMAKMASSIGAIHHFKRADEVNSVMNAFNKAPAWKEGTQVVEATLKPGTRVQMVVDKVAFEAIERGDMNFVGNWASFDNIPNQAFARNNLAITNEFKKDVGYVIELEIVKPVNTQIGIVGPQGAAQGGSSQLNFLFEQRNGGEFFKRVNAWELP